MSDDDAKRARVAYEAFRGGLLPMDCDVPRWEDAPSWIRDVALVAYLQGKLDAPKVSRAPPQAVPVLDWLATKTNYELSFSGWDNEDPTWDVHSVNGGRNDREWTLLATGSTPEEALRKAMSLSLTRPQSGITPSASDASALDRSRNG